MRTEELIPYERNQKKHDEKQIRNVANSIRRFGWQQPIVIDQKGVIVIGHCRWEAAKLLHQETGGYETVPVVCADNLTEDEIRELRIVDNKTNESPWDFKLLETDMKELRFDGFDFDLGDPFAAESDAAPADENDGLDTDKYSDKIGEVIYEPKETHHQTCELFEENTTFAEEIAGIEDEALRRMLTLRSAWFCRFDFAKIADYYAYQASEKEQHIIERLGLVLLDRDKMIEHNFADLMAGVDKVGGD